MTSPVRRGFPSNFLTQTRSFPSLKKGYMLQPFTVKVTFLPSFRLSTTCEKKMSLGTTMVFPSFAAIFENGFVSQFGSGRIGEAFQMIKRSGGNHF